jgi:hypothetical protein
VNRYAIALLIWLGVDVLLSVVAAPVIVFVFIPGLMRAWDRHDLAYMIDILLPNVTLLIVPGAIIAGAYLLIASRTARG